MRSLLPQSIIVSLSEKFAGVFNVLTVSPLGGGCINHACRLETNQGVFFLKWNTTGASDMFVREAESLAEMQKSNNEYVVFPKPIFWKEIDDTPGYLLTDFLEGGMIGNDDERLGRGLAMLHQVSAETFGFAHNNYCGLTLQDNSRKSDWSQFYIENRIGYLVRLISRSQSWSSSDARLTEEFLTKAETLLYHHPRPALIHGDLWSGNYMYTTQGPALIDPACCYCDREFEMGIMTMFGGFSQRVYDAYNEVYPLLPDWKERNPIYQLYHVLNHYYLFGGYYKHEALSIMKKYL